MLLKEVRVLTDLQVISESRETGVMCIRGTFQRAEEPNHNQRIYPRAVLENCVKNLHEKLKGRELVGELDHPADGVVKLQNASHLITKLEWKGNDLIGEAEILPTPAGQIAKSLINAGVKIGISSRGMGTLSESVKGPKIVNDDYKMITFDLVADPSTKGAYPSLAESRQHAIDFVENVIKPAISEKAFVARLKKTLNEAKANRQELPKFEVLVKTEKLEEMCGPNKHRKRKKVNENSYRPLTLTSLNEQELVNEAVPAVLAALGRGAATGARAVGRGLAKAGGKVVDAFKTGYNNKRRSDKIKRRTAIINRNERADKPLNILKPRKALKTLVARGERAMPNPVRGVMKKFADSKRSNRLQDAAKASEERRDSLNKANTRFMNTAIRDAGHTLARIKGREARQADDEKRGQEARTNLRRRALANLSPSNEHILPLTLDRLEEGLFRFGGKVLGHGLETAAREKWLGRAGAGVGKALGGAAGLAGYLGGKKLGAATTRMGMQAGKSVGATLGRLGDYTTKQIARPDITRRWGEKADQAVATAPRRAMVKGRRKYRDLKRQGGELYRGTVDRARLMGGQLGQQANRISQGVRSGFDSLKQRIRSSFRPTPTP